MNEIRVHRTKALIAGGLTQWHLQRLIRSRELFPVFRGVYSETPLTGGVVLAAAVCLRPQIVFTGKTAIEIYEKKAITLPIHGLVPYGQSHRGPKNLHLKHVRHLPHRIVSGFKVATPIRSLADAKEISRPHRSRLLEKWYPSRKGPVIFEKEYAEMPWHSREIALIGQRAAIGADGEHERIMSRQLRNRGVKVEQNKLLDGCYWDLVLEGDVVRVEIDGPHHEYTIFDDARGQFLRDRWKANAAVANGSVVLNFTPECLREHMDTCIEVIMTTLAYRKRHHLAGSPAALTRSYAGQHPVWDWHEHFRVPANPYC